MQSSHKEMSKMYTIAIIILLSVSFAVVSADPQLLYDNLSRCPTATDTCPNENVTFWFYTRSTQATPTQLDMADPQAVNSANYAKGRPFIVLIHGYTGHKDYSPNSHIRPALFQNDEFNVISIDYGPLAPEPCYIHAVNNLPVVAKCTAQLLDYMMEQKIFTLDDLHIIGFSLGGQTAGMISNYIKTGKLKHITGLDPAKPMFIFANQEHRLGPDDAEFVDVVHTDCLARGILAASGHADFYANGGILQPGCAPSENQTVGSCNHDRAPIYYAESINSKEGFWGFKCKDWSEWALGRCNSKTSNETAEMGWRVSKETRGTYIVYTNSKPPYARGKDGSSNNIPPTE